MTHYSEITNPAKATQLESARSDQVANNAGGFVFEVGPWQQLDRFLILGQTGPTYYAGERKIVKENAVVLERCLAEDGPRVIRRIIEISDSGRAPKNDPAIFALAVAAGAKDPATRAAALAALPKVCRIGTHLFHFAADVQTTRGWGRGLRSAIGAWYTAKGEAELAMQAVKQAQYDHGHAGYSGTIAEKTEFKMIKVPKGRDPEDYAESDEALAEVDDKWGPAGCIDLGKGEWLFFGWASS